MKLRASKCRYILLHPEQSSPLVLEAKIAAEQWRITGEEAKRRESIADIDPDLGAFCGDVLRLRSQPMGGAKLQEPVNSRMW